MCQQLSSEKIYGRQAGMASRGRSVHITILTFSTTGSRYIFQEIVVDYSSHWLALSVAPQYHITLIFLKKLKRSFRLGTN